VTREELAALKEDSETWWRVEAVLHDYWFAQENMRPEEAVRRLLEQFDTERRWIEAARDWYRDHRSSKGGIYDEGTWGDPFAVPGEAEMPVSSADLSESSGATATSPVSSPVTLPLFACRHCGVFVYSPPIPHRGGEPGPSCAEESCDSQQFVDAFVAARLAAAEEALLTCRHYLLEDANGETSEGDYYEALNATEIATSNPAISQDTP
jgi:hypothetical protein